MKDLLEDLSQLRDYFRKESFGYAKLSGLKDGDKPEDSTPEMRGCVYSSGTYRLCAKMLNDIIEKYNDQK